MDEVQGLNLILDAKDDLKNLTINSNEIKDTLNELFKQQNSEIELPQETEIVQADTQAQTYAQTISSIEVDALNDLIHFNYMQTVTGFVIVVVLMLMLGVQLFQTFNQHWK